MIGARIGEGSDTRSFGISKRAPEAIFGFCADQFAVLESVVSCTPGYFDNVENSGQPLAALEDARVSALKPILRLKLKLHKATHYDKRVRRKPECVKYFSYRQSDNESSAANRQPIADWALIRIITEPATASPAPLKVSANTEHSGNGESAKDERDVARRHDTVPLRAQNNIDPLT